MNKEDIKIANKSLFEGYVFFDDRKFNILLTIDNEKLLFQKKKGIFKKKLVTEKEIYIKDIKINKDKIGVRYNNDRVTILANSEVFKFTCSSEEDAMKIKDVLKKLIIIPKKKGKFKKIFKGAVGVAGAAISSGAILDVCNAISKKDAKLAAKAVNKFIDKM